MKKKYSVEEILRILSEEKPTWGIRKITSYLREKTGKAINHKRVEQSNASDEKTNCKREYNEERPHGSWGNIPPSLYARQLHQSILTNTKPNF